MEIKYLKKLLQHNVFDGEMNEGVSEIEIQAAEAKHHVKFPLAYREFLFLAGKYEGFLHFATTDLETVSSEWFHELMGELIKSGGIVINKPYWIFSHGDDFSFFYLEEGVEDPKVFYTVEGATDDKDEIVAYNGTFSEYINEAIDGALRIEKRGIW